MPATREFSAGGVVVRPRGDQFDVAVINPRGRNVIALPKGHIDFGETAPQAAQREVKEETGLTTRFECRLGDVKYVYKWQGKSIFKVVSFFLFFWVEGEIDALTPEMRIEVDRAFWLSLDEAKTKLAFFGERDMASRALLHLSQLKK